MTLKCARNKSMILRIEKCSEKEIHLEQMLVSCISKEKQQRTLDV
jgi:hypothetical protein